MFFLVCFGCLVLLVGFCLFSLLVCLLVWLYSWISKMKTGQINVFVYVPGANKAIHIHPHLSNFLRFLSSLVCYYDLNSITNVGFCDWFDRCSYKPVCFWSLLLHVGKWSLARTTLFYFSVALDGFVGLNPFPGATWTPSAWGACRPDNKQSTAKGKVAPVQKPKLRCGTSPPNVATTEPPEKAAKSHEKLFFMFSSKGFFFNDDLHRGFGEFPHLFTKQVALWRISYPILLSFSPEFSDIHEATRFLTPS